MFHRNEGTHRAGYAEWAVPGFKKGGGEITFNKIAPIT